MEKYKEIRKEQLKNGFIQKQIEEMKLSYTYEAFLGQITSLQNGKPIFLPNDPSFVPPSYRGTRRFYKRMERVYQKV
ncbi:hypothetical protein ACT7DZ_13545 [Bacillus cereus]